MPEDSDSERELFPGSVEFENPVQFEFGKGMTHQKLSDPLFELEHERISRALVAALIGTIVLGPLTYMALINGVMDFGVTTLIVVVWLWVRAGRRALALRRVTGVVMDESNADQDNVWSTHQANRVIRSDDNG
ncbi:hypothetical protein [Halobacterium salinarum]|uniref:hypothetical protein n=1 Tax=Halobacterium salinarum TaxID=2242 RepID=UPI001F23F730|nr:hypothetical protein [Halobacterium salinarum]MCF2165391.1 hypothetical protein [Halobacterium salinarum]MCF2168251.1 hypothetical protein [Halobacterium salinarum]